MKTRKILVQTIHGDQGTTFKKYPVDANHKILIRTGGGAGIKTLEPTVKPEMVFKKGRLNTPYLIYPMGAETFLSRNDKVLPPFSMKAVDEFFESGVLDWIRRTLTKKAFLELYLIIGLNVFGLLMMAQGFGFINVR